MGLRQRLDVVKLSSHTSEIACRKNFQIRDKSTSLNNLIVSGFVVATSGAKDNIIPNGRVL